MDPRESVRIATRSVRAHKLRSALTILGVVIGIASVVAFATFGASVKADIVGDIEDTSANNVYVFASPDDEEGFEVALQPLFTEHDLARLRAIEGVWRAIPRGTVQVSSLTVGNDTISPSTVTATTPASIRNGSISRGRAFRSGAAEMVLNRPATRAFERNLSVGSTVRVVLASGETRNVTVVGIVNGTEGQLPVSSFAERPRFFLPLDPFYRTVVESPSVGVRQRAYPQVTVVTDPVRVSTTKERVRTYLESESDAARLAPAGVSLSARTGSDFVDRVQSFVDRITRFVTGIAVIALVVGAIGIANIMLVSVTERTKEIGIMKAVGARNRDVMGLFLVEAAALGTAGAVVGVPLGIGVGYAATRYAETGFSLAPGWSALAVLVGLLVGVVSGLYPAYRAARVDPIDALRYE